MIPHIIHYCWFGKNKKSDLIEKCIQSWKKYLPEWEIREWNEDNFDVNVTSYSRDAYLCKKWAFVSDYVRFKVLYDYGGIYFDTDVELLKPISEEILEHKAFTGVETTHLVSPGLVFACEMGFPLVREMLRTYERAEFDESKLKTVNQFITELLQMYGYSINGCYQEIASLAVYEMDVFCGYDIEIGEPKITDRTIAMHHYASSWRKKGWKHLILFRIKKVVGAKKYRELLDFKRKLLKEKKTVERN